MKQLVPGCKKESLKSLSDVNVGKSSRGPGGHHYSTALSHYRLSLIYWVYAADSEFNYSIRSVVEWVTLYCLVEMLELIISSVMLLPRASRPLVNVVNGFILFSFFNIYCPLGLMKVRWDFHVLPDAGFPDNIQRLRPCSGCLHLPPYTSPHSYCSTLSNLKNSLLLLGPTV